MLPIRPSVTAEKPAILAAIRQHGTIAYLLFSQGLTLPLSSREAADYRRFRAAWHEVLAEVNALMTQLLLEYHVQTDADYLAAREAGLDALAQRYAQEAEEQDPGSPSAA